MIKERELLYDQITKKCEMMLKNVKVYKSLIEEYCTKLYSLYNIPFNISIDILTLKADIKDYDDFILFAVTKTTFKDKNIIKEFFSSSEISEYSKKKYLVEKIKFPIKWNMVQVSEDQWIGAITVKELMALRDARLIHYNENTQRPLTRKTINGEEFYRITINETAVQGIIDSYLKGTYISNTITLNIPETADMSYQNGELIIRNIDKFDILDGYHRYLAIQRIYAEDKSFDYTMEFRLVCFPEEKAKQFIWQEDQKTKMSKIDSDSLNQNSIANQIVNRLNQKSPFTGLINNNKSIIDAGNLSYFIDTYFCQNIPKKQERQKMIELANKIYSKLLLLVDDDPELLDKKWDILLIIAVIHIIYDDIDDKYFVREVKKLRKLLSLPENDIIAKNFKTKHIHKVDIKRIDNIYKTKES